MNATNPAAPRRRGLNIVLALVQIVLAFAFGAAGLMKLTQPIEALAASMPWVSAVPSALVRFIGLAELAGALGLILPWLTRIKPQLISLAAIGLILVMVLASAFHLSRGEAGAIPVNVVLAALAAFVAWGRSKAAPIQPRA
ncbi:MAG TPA: DoxX family protein [Thermoanaerobaculia bacterium]|nr:DoxX family protein [Thermoanaerobaculia bacterium]